MCCERIFTDIDARNILILKQFTEHISSHNNSHTQTEKDQIVNNGYLLAEERLLLCTIQNLELVLLLQLENFKTMDRKTFEDFPGGTVDKNTPANTRDMGSIPGLGRFHVPQGN